MRRRRKKTHHSAFYSEETEPTLRRITAPLPLHLLPYDPWWWRLLRGIGHFCAAIMRKVNQLLALALAVLLLLLFIRVLLTFFDLDSSLFAYWVYLLSDPLVFPFANLLPVLSYDGYRLDVSTLVAIVIYALAVMIVRQFFKVLVARV